MSIAELKVRLSDVPGIENLAMRLLGGRQCFEWGAGKIAAVDPLAPDDEIDRAIRAAASLNAPINPESNGTAGAATLTAAPAPSPSASLIPTVNAVTAQPKAKPMTITGAGAAGHSLKALIEAQKAKIANDLAANMAKIQDGFDKQNAAVAAVGNLGDKVHAEADDLMASVGQFSNDLGLDQ